MTTATTTVIDFGPLGTFEIESEPTWSQLIAQMERGIGSDDRNLQYEARKASVMLRQRLHDIQPDQV